MTRIKVPAVSNLGYPAAFSPQRKYRYTLWRVWQERPLRYVMFIGLNPSTADETKDDATIRRCRRYAQDWGFNATCMTNLFAWRETKSKRLLTVKNPVGKQNDMWLDRIASGATLIVACWGTKGHFMGRDIEVMDLLRDHNLYSFGTTKDGFPKHPLRLPASLKPAMFVESVR